MREENRSLVAQVEALRQMSVEELRKKWREVFKEEPSVKNHDHLWRGLAREIQARASGGPDELIPETKPRRKARPKRGTARRDPRLPLPGTILVRDYKGTRVEVEVLEKAFVYEGTTYRSLSAIAREVTGSHWNGLLFFGLTKAGKGRRRR